MTEKSVSRISPKEIPSNRMQKKNAFKIDEVTIVSSTGVKKKLPWVVISINEDIFSTSISGSVQVKDGINLLRNVPIVGQEQILISWETPGIGSGKITKSFRVYKIGEKAISENGQVQVYKLHFTSNSAIDNMKTKCNYAIQNKTITEMVEYVFKKHFPNNKLNVVQNSVHEHTFILPYRTPFSCINWLCKRGINGSISGDYSFLFYEDLDGFKLNTVANMLKSKIKSSYHYKIPNRRNISTFSTLLEDFKNLDGDAIHFQKSSNKLKEIQNGMYSSVLFLHDLTTKTYTAKLYDYFSHFDSMNKGQEKYPVLADVDATTKAYATNVRYKPKSTASVGNITLDELNENPFKYNNDRYEEWTQPKQSFEQQIQSQEIVLSIAGDSSKRVGQMIGLVFPSPEPHAGKTELELDEYVSGDYLITSIEHNIGRLDYTMKLEVCRTHFPSQLPTGKV
jgi:hypothetical protein